jgi:hypothetical protein
MKLRYLSAALLRCACAGSGHVIGQDAQPKASRKIGAGISYPLYSKCLTNTTKRNVKVNYQSIYSSAASNNSLRKPSILVLDGIMDE